MTRVAKPRFIKWRAIVFVVLTLAIQPPAASQHKIKVETKVVNVLASVFDANGRVIADLSKEDFVLEEDGRPQSIRYFSQQADSPLALGLLVDTSGSLATFMPQQRLASYQFLDKMLRPEIDVALFLEFGEILEVWQGFTNSKKKLERALRQLEKTRGNLTLTGEFRTCNGRFSLTVLYDGIAEAANEARKLKQRRKALVVLSDGLDHGSCKSLEQAIADAQGAEVMVYTVAMGEFGNREDLREKGIAVLQQIAVETGGGYFDGSRGRPIDLIYAVIDEELRHQYFLWLLVGRERERAEVQENSAKHEARGADGACTQGVFRRRKTVVSS